MLLQEACTIHPNVGIQFCWGFVIILYLCLTPKLLHYTALYTVTVYESSPLELYILFSAQV